MNLQQSWLIMSLGYLYARAHGLWNLPNQSEQWRNFLEDYGLAQPKSTGRVVNPNTVSRSEVLEESGSLSGFPTNDYNVSVTVSIMPKDDRVYSSLVFTKNFLLRGRNFSDVASQVDFIYDTIEGAGK